MSRYEYYSLLCHILLLVLISLQTIGQTIQFYYYHYTSLHFVNKKTLVEPYNSVLVLASKWVIGNNYTPTNNDAI